MQNYSIALGGIEAAQLAFDVIANNLANAATEGYHRQRLELVPAYQSQVGGVILGGGVDIGGVTRMIDDLLEQEILRQQSSLGEISKQLDMLRTVETALGELSAKGGLNSAMGEFFSALQDLAAHPSEFIWQTQVVTTAQTLASQFNLLGEFLRNVQTQIRYELDSVVGQINTLVAQIAKLNEDIQRIEMTGGLSGNLRDQRDQYITELSKLIGVETVRREYGSVDVGAGGIPLVTGVSFVELEVGFLEAGTLGVSIAGANNYDSQVRGGSVGALLALNNEIIAGIHTDLDDLAANIVRQVNQHHVQGVGSGGSFTELTGWKMTSENLADFDPPVSNGKIYIRVTDTVTGQISRREINVNASTATLSTIAAAIDALPGLSASVNSSKLTILADANYEFDFLPAVLSEPTSINLTGVPPPAISISGVYSGDVNDTLRFAVTGAGSVGNGTFKLEVRTAAGTGALVATLNIGSGYAAGDLLDIGNGIRIAIGPGDFAAGNYFDANVFANTDTSGLLAALGINTFFSGKNAADMAVCPEIAAAPHRIATSLGPDMTDNANAMRLAELKDYTFAAFGGLTALEFYRRLVTDMAQQIYVKQIRQDNIEGTLKSLSDQQSSISGVNINDEAARMLVFEQMFTAMAKYLSTVQSSISALMEIV